MRRLHAQRQIMLAGIALLAAAVALAITSRHTQKVRAAGLPPSYGNYSALFGASSSSTAKPTSCGVQIGPGTMGVMSPVLPCGVRLYLSYRGRHVLASVIGRSATGTGREFELTRALARRLGVTGVKRMRWSYAGTR